MSIQDPIANLFSSINNAQARGKSSVLVPSSTKKLALVELLKEEGYVGSYSVTDSSKPEIEIKLKYFDGAPEEVYRDKDVCVDGKISSYKGGPPQIIVETSSSIKILHK